MSNAQRSESVAIVRADTGEVVNVAPFDMGTAKRRVDPQGYVRFGDASHEHVRVAERVLGRRLPPGACVHHINHARTDNRPANLVLCDSNSYHRLLHVRERALDATGDPTSRQCQFCHQWDAAASLIRTSNAGHAHLACKNKYQREGYARRSRRVST